MYFRRANSLGVKYRSIAWSQVPNKRWTLVMVATTVVVPTSAYPVAAWPG